MKVFPESCLGKWAALLTLGCIFFLVIFFLFMFMGKVSFDEGHWWDVTVGVTVAIELIAFVFSIITLRKDRNVLTYCTFTIGIIAIIFLLTHSLYIHD
jgi:hypothetical protein